MNIELRKNVSLKLLLLPLVMLMGARLYSQDIQFSQFYSAALYQNPAFAGAVHSTRFSAHQRIQWPGLDAKYLTSLVSFDTYSTKYKSGFGFVALRDVQGKSTISSTDIGLQYSYEVNLSRSLTFRPGLQISYVSRSLNYAGLTLPENFDSYGQNSAASIQPGQNKQYVDISSGGIVYSDKMWFGFSAHHLNTPNQSFMSGVSKLPMQVAFTGGYKIILKKSPYHTVEHLGGNKEYSITPTFHYKFQGKSDQVDIGFYGIFEDFVAGVWYRGIPVKYYSRDIVNSESIIFLAGWKFDNISITYSYDFTTSGLIRAGTGGSHEFDVTYVLKNHHHKKPMRRLPCPDFNRHR